MTSLKAHGKQRETKNAKRDGMFKAVRSVVYVSECVKNVVCECWWLNDKRIKAHGVTGSFGLRYSQSAKVKHLLYQIPIARKNKAQVNRPKGH